MFSNVCFEIFTSSPSEKGCCISVIDSPCLIDLKPNTVVTFSSKQMCALQPLKLQLSRHTRAEALKLLKTLDNHIV